MSDADPTAGEAASATGGDEASVFSSLPRSRPAVRSPRRAEPVRAEPDPEPGAEAEVGLLAGREEEIEALARASLSLAGDVASLGFRAASRAAAAVRKTVERS